MSIARALVGGALLAMVAGILFFQDLGRSPLLDPDEARHAEVAREMAEARGMRRFFLPTLAFRPYREKPAGYYWLVALSYGVGGVGESAARAPSALLGLAGVLALYAYALPRFGLAGALGAGLVAATSAGWFVLARYANLDMTLTACVVTGVLAGLAWLERPAPRRPPLVPYLGVGFGLLVKGPVALALVGTPLVMAGLARRPRPAFAELGLARGGAIIVGLAALLYVPVGVLDATYLTAFAATNLRRWTPSSPHPGGIAYYVLWLPVLLLPWTPLAPPALLRAWRDPVRKPLVLWAAAVPALLTLPRGKLPTYALSALAPLALLVGPELARAVRAGVAEKDAPVFRAAGSVFIVALAAAAVVALAVPYPIPVATRAVLATVALAWSAALAILLRRRRFHLLPLAVLAVMLTVYPLASRCVVPAGAELHSHREAAGLITAAGPAPVLLFAIRDPSLTFYLRAPVIHTSEPDFLRDVFAADGLALLVTSRAHFAEVEAILGSRAHLWHDSSRRRLYANRPQNASTSTATR